MLAMTAASSALSNKMTEVLTLNLAAISASSSRTSTALSVRDVVNKTLPV